MSGQLMLINPRKRRTTRAKRKATPAQLRSLAKARRARSGLATNPRKRRSLRAVSRAPGRRRVRRNPVGMGGIMGNLMGAATAATGALAVDVVGGFLPLPADWSMGNKRQMVNIGLALGLGVVGRKVLGRSAGKMAEGALTVAAYNIIKSFVPPSMGGNAGTVAGLGYMSPGMVAGSLPNTVNNGSMQGMGEYVSGLGEYVY